MTAALVAAILAALGAVVATMVRARVGDQRRWSKEADKLARNYDIALRPDVAARVAGHLRRQYVISAVLMAPLLVLVNVWLRHMTDHREPHHYAVSYSLTLIALPLLTIAYGVAFAVPAWNRARAPRVTHLRRPTPWQICTRREWVAVSAGVLITVLCGSWGLWRVAAGGWWLAWLATLLTSVLAWRWAARLILTRPSQASDNVELGWDDVLRHKEARELTIAAAWGPALILVLLDWQLTGSGDLLPIYAVIGVGAALTQVFKQGRHLWRQSWNGLGPA